MLTKYEYTDQIDRYIAPDLAKLGFPEGQRGGDNFGNLDPVTTRVWRQANVVVAICEDLGRVVITTHGTDDTDFERGYMWKVNLTMDAPAHAIAGNAKLALSQILEERAMEKLHAAASRRRELVKS